MSCLVLNQNDFFFRPPPHISQKGFFGLTGEGMKPEIKVTDVITSAAGRDPEHRIRLLVLKELGASFLNHLRMDLRVLTRSTSAF